MQKKCNLPIRTHRSFRLVWVHDQEGLSVLDQHRLGVAQPRHVELALLNHDGHPRRAAPQTLPTQNIHVQELLLSSCRNSSGKLHVYTKLSETTLGHEDVPNNS